MGKWGPRGKEQGRSQNPFFSLGGLKDATQREKKREKFGGVSGDKGEEPHYACGGREAKEEEAKPRLGGDQGKRGGTSEDDAKALRD